MILSIELDPFLEGHYYLDSLLPGLKNKSQKTTYNIGGKGISLARILKNFSSKVSITGFLGGYSGEYIFEEIKKYDLANEFIRLRDESRRDIVLNKDEKFITAVAGLGPRITREDLNSFFERYTDILDNFNIICGVGDLPDGLDEDVYYNLISIAKSRGKRFFLDIRGVGLLYGLDAAPFMVKMDKKDLEELTNVEINNHKEVASLGRGILESGVEILVVDLHEDGSVVLSRDKAYKLEIYDCDTGFSNEDKAYTVAGYAFAMDRGYDFETTMKLAQSFRIAYGLEDINKVDMSDIKAIMKNIEILEINY